MTDVPQPTKAELRARVRAARRLRTVAERAADSAALTAHLAELCEARGVRLVLAHLSRPEEPDTRGFLAWARAHGIQVLLPVSRLDGSMGWALDDGSEGRDALGMPAPTGPEVGSDAWARADLALIPAASVARDGTRLGWGRGYFDRALGSASARGPVYAVVLDQELVDELPREAHDIPVDGVVAPGGITVL